MAKPGAGAQLSHYIFFCHYANKNEEINNVLNLLTKYQNGWYSIPPKKPHIIINGIMKVMSWIRCNWQKDK